MGMVRHELSSSFPGSGLVARWYEWPRSPSRPRPAHRLMPRPPGRNGEHARATASPSRLRAAVSARASVRISMRCSPSVVTDGGPPACSRRFGWPFSSREYLHMRLTVEGCFAETLCRSAGGDHGLSGSRLTRVGERWRMFPPPTSRRAACGVTHIEEPDGPGPSGQADAHRHSPVPRERIGKGRPTPGWPAARPAVQVSVSVMSGP